MACPFFAFDLIGLDDHDLCDLPLIERKRRLARLIGKAKHAMRFIGEWRRDAFVDEALTSLVSNYIVRYHTNGGRYGNVTAHFHQAAGGTGLALVGAGGVFAATRTPNRALLPWEQLDGAPPADVRLDAFRHAILAPNPHNRQPWLIQLAGQDRAVIFCDLDRRLPQTDPFDRQILIGFGCFLEIARSRRPTAASYGDRAVSGRVSAERLDRRPIASLRFAASGTVTKDPLFAAIPNRRSNKQPFDTVQSG